MCARWDAEDDNVEVGVRQEVVESRVVRDVRIVGRRRVPFFGTTLENRVQPKCFRGLDEGNVEDLG